MNNKFTYKSQYGEYHNCQFMIGYYENGNLGIEIWSDTEGPITKVTVNPDIKIPKDRIAIKNYSENEGIVDWLISEGIIEDTPVQIIPSGWIEIPVHKLTAKGLDITKE